MSSESVSHSGVPASKNHLSFSETIPQDCGVTRYSAPMLVSNGRLVPPKIAADRLFQVEFIGRFRYTQQGRWQEYSAERGAFVNCRRHTVMQSVYRAIERHSGRVGFSTYYLSSVTSLLRLEALCETASAPVAPPNPLPAQTTQDEVLALLKQYPLLTLHGFGEYETPRLVTAKGKADLLAATQQIDFARDWLRTQTRRKTINLKHSSYGLKHIAENYKGRFGGGAYNNYTSLSPTVIYLLSAPSTPEAVIEKAVAKSESGERGETDTASPENSRLAARRPLP